MSESSWINVYHSLLKAPNFFNSSKCRKLCRQEDFSHWSMLNPCSASRETQTQWRTRQPISRQRHRPVMSALAVDCDEVLDCLVTRQTAQSRFAVMSIWF